MGEKALAATAMVEHPLSISKGDHNYLQLRLAGQAQGQGLGSPRGPSPLPAAGQGLDEQQQRWQAMAMENERLHRELVALKHSQGQEDKGQLLQQQQQVGLGLAEIAAFETRERVVNDQLLAAEAAFHSLLQRDATTWLHIESFQSTMKKFFRFQIEEDDMRAKVDDVFRLLDATRKQGTSSSPSSSSSYSSSSSSSYSSSSSSSLLSSPSLS